MKFFLSDVHLSLKHILHLQLEDLAGLFQMHKLADLKILPSNKFPDELIYIPKLKSGNGQN